MRSVLPPCRSSTPSGKRGGTPVNGLPFPICVALSAGAGPVLRRVVRLSYRLQLA